jgi:predicted ATP-dependent endonuclease of OLD family
MQLISFRIFNFRSIDDSGDIEVSRITALLGRNESGKSNLLLGLRTLNPVEGFVALNPTKDFPRHRKLSDCFPDTMVVSSSWALTADEQHSLRELFTRAANVTRVIVERPYQKSRSVQFQNLSLLESLKSEVVRIGEEVRAETQVANQGLPEEQQKLLGAAIDKFEHALAAEGNSEKWAKDLLSAAAELETTLTTAGTSEKLDRLQELAEIIEADKEVAKKAEEWIIGRLPVFIYLDEYPELDGYQSISQYLNRKAHNQAKESDHNFEKLCKVAGLDPAQLNELHTQGKHEERNLIANRASAVVTKELRRLWKDRSLKVRFNVDADYFETLVSDPTSAFDVEVNLNERSRGLRWFFSFYITFSADTNAGRAENAILLLDEPGLFLHIESQRDLQAHFERDFKIQIIYTTHSPYMIPIQALDRLRTVNVAEEIGTTVTNNPTGDGRTLAPIRAALGYQSADPLTVGPNNLIIEGVTDWWILEAVSKHFISAKKPGLPTGLSLPPVDGASKVPNMVGLLTSQRLNVLVLFDDEGQARAVSQEMIKSRLIRDRQIIFVTEAFDQKPSEADVEDLLDPAIYEELARDAYADELAGKILVLNANIPRIVKRLEEGFEKIELTFHKTRPAGLFFRRMAANPVGLMTDESTQRFERLFAIIDDRLKKVISLGSEPFR